jgi:hypothetical protein
MSPSDVASIPPRRLGSLTLAAVFVAASAVTALDYSFFVGDPTLVSRRSIHQGVLAHTATAPDRYRLLAPLMVEGPVRVLEQWMPRDLAFDRVYAVFYVTAMTALLWSLFAYLRVWFTDEQALIAVLIVASTLRITIRQHDYAPFSFLEPTFIALGLLLMLDERWLLLGVVVAVAAFNRETGIFLVLLFAATRPLNRSNIVMALIYGAVWAAVFVGVRVYGGEAERYWELGRIWRTNLSQPGLTLYNVTAFLGIVWILAIAGYTRAPEFVRRAAIVVPVYAAVVAIWGLWWEVRLLLPLLPLVLPLALSAIFSPSSAALRVGMQPTD